MLGLVLIIAQNTWNAKMKRYAEIGSPCLVLLSLLKYSVALALLLLVYGLHWSTYYWHTQLDFHFLWQKKCFFFKRQVSVLEIRFISTFKRDIGTQF